MHRIFVCICAIILIGCAANSYERNATSDKCCINTESKELHYYVREASVYGKEYPEGTGFGKQIKKELDGRGFSQIVLRENDHSYRNFCAQYQRYLLVSLDFLTPADYGQLQAVITGLSLGLIPSWLSKHPSQDITFQLFDGCQERKKYSFTIQEEVFIWLFALPFSQLPKYKNSYSNTVKDIANEVFGDMEINK